MRVPGMARLLGGAACVFATACDSATENRSFSFTLSEQSASVGQGSTKSVAITITRNRFDGPVNFVVEGLPAGVTGTFAPAAAAGATSALQLAVSGSAAAGATTLTVRATGEGVAEQTATFDLAVVITGSFTLSALNPTVTVAQGGAGSTSVLVNRTGGFAGAVGVSLSGAPAGLTATLGAATTEGSSVLLSIAANAGLAAGNYTLTATGTYAGLSNQQTSISISVIAPPATASVTVTYCASDTPLWVAYRNEGYGWQAAAASGASFTFQATERVATAVVFASSDGVAKQTNVSFSTRDEFASQVGRDCGGTKTVSGSVSGLSTAHQARASMGAFGPSTLPTSTSPSFTIANLPDRALDLVATRGVTSGTAFTPERMIIRRGLNPADGATLPALDFAAGEAFDVQQSAITLTNTSPNDELTLINTFWSATATFGGVHRTGLASSTGAYFGVPAAQLAGGDVHELYLDAYQATSQVGRSMLSYFGAPGDRTENFGAFLAVPRIATLASAPYARIRGRVDSQADYGSAVRFGVQQQLAQNDVRTVYVIVTSGHLGGTPTQWDLVVPDFTGVAGFSTAWMLTAGQTTIWQTVAFGGRAALLLDASPVAGDLLRFSDRQGVIAGSNVRLILPRRALMPSQYFRR